MTTTIILLSFAIGVFTGIGLFYIFNKESKEKEEIPEFDEADIYHLPKYYPRITKEQEQ